MLSLNFLVDNIFVGHDAADAKALAKETFHVKRAFEKDADELDDEEDAEGKLRFQDVIKLKLMQFRSESCSLRSTTEAPC